MRFFSKFGVSSGVARGSRRDGRFAGLCRRPGGGGGGNGHAARLRLTLWTVSTTAVARALSSSGGGGSVSLSPQLRSWLVSNQRTSSSSSKATSLRHRVVFLGSPGVAATALDALLTASSQNRGDFHVVACVSQPPKKKGRKMHLQKSEAHELAEKRGVPAVLTPASARDPEFLDALRALEPDLCITAAYGQFLPKTFLDIPRKGTLNVHPSLLPRYRGAAPLQRALENGDFEVGVTVLQTVLEMDAGPIVAQQRRPVREDDQCAKLLDELFVTGVDLLVEKLPAFWRDEEDSILEPQDAELATRAPKLSNADARLDLLLCDHSTDARSVAQRARDKVRAFQPWPGTWLAVRKGEEDDVVRLKVLDARVGLESPTTETSGRRLVSLSADGTALLAPCADGSVLELRRVQPPNRKPVDAISYWNGLRGATLELVTWDDPPP